MTVDVRPARRADLPRLTALLGRQFAANSLQPPDAVVEDALSRLLRRPSAGRVLVGVVDGEIAGIAVLSFLFTIEHGGPAAWLEELFVASERRRGGVGRALLAAACATAAAEGAHALDLEVEPGHDPAIALYERAGFRRHDRRRFFLPLVPAQPAQPAIEPPFTGGCACGAVRYVVTATSTDVSHCHCTICRRSTGAPFVAWATLPSTAFAWTAGVPAERRSTPTAVRTHCRDCGTALTFREAARPGLVDVTVASFDAPEAFPPREHIFVRSRVPWVQLADGLPEFDGDHPA